jgi:hypothetical protein
VATCCSPEAIPINSSQKHENNQQSWLRLNLKQRARMGLHRMELDLIKVDSSSNSARFAQATTTGQFAYYALPQAKY